MNQIQSILDRLEQRDRFSLAEVRAWMRHEGDLVLWAAVYELLSRGVRRIRPEPDADETGAFVTRYLLRCVREDVSSDFIPSGYEAAGDLAANAKSLARKLPEMESILEAIAERVKQAWLAADEAERDRLVNGFLEHALESPPVRRFFRPWKDDPALAEAWRLAMDWGAAHEEQEAHEEQRDE